MVSRSHVHWQAPTTMVGALLVGSLAAIGHHCFYSSLVGTIARADETEQSILGFQVSRQQINLAIGTTLTFFATSCFVTAISTAYIQVVWSTARRSKSNSYSLLGDLDAIFSILQNLFSVGNTIWLTYPLLLLLGLMSWLVPITSIIPPATLSVQSAYVDPAPTALLHVPNVDFTSLNYVGPMPMDTTLDGDSPDDEDYGFHDEGATYRTASPEVLQVAQSVASQGVILPITPPTPNSSWALDFFGPSLRCERIEGSLRRELEQNIADWTFQDQWTRQHCGNPPVYLAWTGYSSPTGYGSSGRSWLPFYRSGGHSTLKLSEGFDSPGKRSLGPMSPLYVAVIPGFYRAGPKARPIACDYANRSTEANPLGTDANDVHPTFLQCSMFNASYHIGFKFESEHRTIALKIDRHEGINIDIPILFKPAQQEDGCIRFPYNNDFGECLSDPALMRILSYTSIFDAFQRQIIGTIQFVRFKIKYFSWATRVLNTKLRDTKELEFLYRDFMTQGTLQGQFHNSRQPHRQGLLHMPQRTATQSLADELEDMFHNITVSMMSVESLQPNLTSIYAPPKTNVTFHRYEATYTYSSRKLWVAYGCAIAVTTVATVIGLVTIFLHGASYSANFSTIFRVARTASIDHDSQSLHDDGTDPLPRRLKRARVMLNPTVTVQKKDEECSQHVETEAANIPMDKRLTITSSGLRNRLNDTEQPTPDSEDQRHCACTTASSAPRLAERGDSIGETSGCP